MKSVSQVDIVAWVYFRRQSEGSHQLNTLDPLFIPSQSIQNVFVNVLSLSPLQQCLPLGAGEAHPLALEIEGPGLTFMKGFPSRQRRIPGSTLLSFNS